MQQARQAVTECTAPIVWQVTRCWKALYLRNVQQKKLEQTDKKGNRRMNKITMDLQVDHLILEALREDISSEDVTTNAVMKEAVTGEVELICKQDGVIAGLDVFERVFRLLDANTKVELYCKDGDQVKNGELMGKVVGDIRVLLSGERVALNYLQRMSGIATYTRSVAELLKGTGTKTFSIRERRRRICVFFEKYAVRAGGGYNHRYNLSDGVLLKDNHIGAAGSVANAVRMAKEYAPFVRKIEVEVENAGDGKRKLWMREQILLCLTICPQRRWRRQSVSLTGELRQNVPEM